jgi:HD-GYP domain-containing protein (c-di-GMP phosphodiesterase class II)
MGREQVTFSGYVHFTGVALAAAFATSAALALTVVGARRLDGRVVTLGGAFSVMAALLCLHGATTPGILVGPNGVVSFTGTATLPIGGALLAFGSVPYVWRPSAVRPLLCGFAVLLIGVVAIGIAAVGEPALIPTLPKPASAGAFALLAAGLLCYGLLALRAFRTFMLTRRPGDLIVAVGITWLAAALTAALTLTFRDLGWWLGHGFQLVGIFLVGLPVALDMIKNAPSRPLVGDLRAAELVAAEEAFLGSQVRGLMLALAEKDTYTEEHTRRVALRAVQVGEELGLSADGLRALALGALLHDIGKLSVPDAILTKPGPLTASEFTVVREHPDRGRRLLRELGGFGERVHRLVLDHHERLDGSGYPRCLGGDEIALDARILAVCDVYDALISQRVYRTAWPHERALALLRDGADSQFDGRCVNALERVLAREHEPFAVAV